MAPKRATRNGSPPPSDPHGMFAGMVVFLVEDGVQNSRLQIWKQKLVQMGATVEDHVSKRVTHMFAMNPEALLQKAGSDHWDLFEGRVVLYQWLEDSLSSGKRVPEDFYHLKLESDKSSSDYISGDEETPTLKRRRSSSPDELPHTPSPKTPKAPNKDQVTALESSTPYSPPDLNKDITEIFGKLINIYRALGDDRRSFSYYKAVPVIEKLPFKIQSAEQVKGLPGIGKSMQDHIQEIVTTGKLSKLEHFETDEKVKTISLFEEIWGVGPPTALKLFEKGHRTLDDLKDEDSLTHSQQLGLKYYDDIKQRIPRHEAQEMELLLQKAAEDVLPGLSAIHKGGIQKFMSIEYLRFENIIA